VTAGIPKPNGEGRGTMVLEEETKGERHTGITIFDKSEPRSVYNLVPVIAQEALDRVHPRIWNFSLKNLEKHAKVDDRLAQLRVAFWHEYNNTQDNFKPSISITKVTHGICSREYFYQTVLKDQMKTAYMMFPTTDYIAAMTEMHEFAMREMRKILQIPNSGKKGANLPVIREKIKIFNKLDDRLRGTVPIRKQSQHLHAHVAVPGPVPAAELVGHEAAPKSLDAINAEINRLERQERDVGGSEKSLGDIVSDTTEGKQKENNNEATTAVSLDE